MEQINTVATVLLKAALVYARIKKKNRTRSQPIRTLSLLPVKIKITMNENIPLYQKLAPKIRELKVLGISINKISKKLNVCPKTVKKALLNH